MSSQPLYETEFKAKPVRSNRYWFRMETKTAKPDFMLLFESVRYIEWMCIRPGVYTGYVVLYKDRSIRSLPDGLTDSVLFIPMSCTWSSAEDLIESCARDLKLSLYCEGAAPRRYRPSYEHETCFPTIFLN